MALITNVTTAWSAPITLTKDEIWQSRKGGVYLSTTASPAAEDGVLLRDGIGIRFSAGISVRYRKEGNSEAVIVREAV